MTSAEFEKIVTDWLAQARDKRFNHPYTELTYQPMIELLAYLRANGFKTFIVSGGEIGFMRPWTEKAYGIPPGQVVGSTMKTQLATKNDSPVILRLPQISFIDDGPGKPVGIDTFIGQRPIAAFGNSDGDQQMLEWTAAGSGPRFMLLVHHTDAAARVRLRPQLVRRQTRQGARRSQRQGLDRRQHEGRLEKNLRLPITAWPATQPAMDCSQRGETNAMILEAVYEPVDLTTAVFRLTGRMILGERLREVESEISKVANQGIHKLILDLSGIEYLDSAGLGALMMLYGNMKVRGGQFRLVAPAPRCSTSSNSTRANSILNIDRNLEAALAS